MIQKTVKNFKRLVYSWESGSRDERHAEKVLRETWWLFGFIPIYMRDTVLTSNL